MKHKIRSVRRNTPDGSSRSETELYGEPQHEPCHDASTPERAMYGAPQHETPPVDPSEVERIQYGDAHRPDIDDDTRGLETGYRRPPPTGSALRGITG